MVMKDNHIWGVDNLKILFQGAVNDIEILSRPAFDTRAEQRIKSTDGRESRFSEGHVRSDDGRGIAHFLGVTDEHSAFRK